MSIVDYFYPRVCLGCGREGLYVCEECRRGIVRVGESLRYTGVIRTAIKAIKYRGTYDMVQELVAIWDPLYREEYRGSLITSVPMWKSKQRVRGYNQAELIAREVANRWGVSYLDLLTRTRETLPMYGLTKNERAENIHGAFSLARDNLPPKRVIVVDDVWTTGSTLRECMRVFKLAGATDVWDIALAR